MALAQKKNSCKSG